MADGEILDLIIIRGAVNIFFANAHFQTLCLMGFGVVQKG